MSLLNGTNAAAWPLTQWKPRLTSAVSALIFLICLCPVWAEEECLKSKVWCYNCESNKDDFCNDPFNATAAQESMMHCQGCCVKVVRERGTPRENIWRTCTSKLQINLFMVDHVCMEESGAKGTMCFCESEACNGAPATVRPHTGSLVLAASLTATLSLPEWPLWPVTSFRIAHCNTFRLVMAAIVATLASLVC